MNTGKASSARIEVNSTFQVKMGIRNIVMPGARRQTMVLTKLTDVSVVLRPETTRPIAHRLPPAPAEWSGPLSGA